MLMIKKKVNNELKEDKFIRIAESRTHKILYYIRLLGNCANKNSYSYTNNQVNKIFHTIEKELAIEKEKFKENKSINFKL